MTVVILQINQVRLVYLNVIINGAVVILLKFNLVLIQTQKNVVKYLKDPSLRQWKFLVIEITNTMESITEWKIGMDIPTMLNKIVQHICIIGKLVVIGI